MRILVSGASIAGPVLAYWLAHYGFDVTVVERAPTLRKTGGHAVDLFKPAMDIVDKMNLMAPIMAKKTGTEYISVYREGHPQPIVIRQGPIFTAVSQRHVEIMRDDLSEVFYDASAPNARYLFGQSIASLAQDETGVAVTFTDGTQQRFDLVIGADGLHSNVRSLEFGPEDSYMHWLGGYLAVATIPDYLQLRDRMLMSGRVNQIAGMYSSAHMDDARALFMFRPPVQLDYHYRDIEQQKVLLRNYYRDFGWEVPRLLDEVDDSDAFYMDSITQLRLDSWTTGRVALVGDAGYCPGPAVGGSTSMAVVGAYVLAGEIATHGSDYQSAFRAYEAGMRDYVLSSRKFAATVARTLIPSSRFGLWALVQSARLVGSLPDRVAGALSRLGSANAANIHDSVRVRDYSR